MAFHEKSFWWGENLHFAAIFADFYGKMILPEMQSVFASNTSSFLLKTPESNHSSTGRAQQVNPVARESNR